MVYFSGQVQRLLKEMILSGSFCGILLSSKELFNRGGFLFLLLCVGATFVRVPCILAERVSFPIRICSSI